MRFECANCGKLISEKEVILSVRLNPMTNYAFGAFCKKCWEAKP
jgi:hypothetical protein